jgi:hypothetical protein
MPDGRIHIEMRADGTGKLLLDGTDIADYVKRDSVLVSRDANSLPTVSVELITDHLTVDSEHGRMVYELTEDGRNVLHLLGWTAPVEILEDGKP